MNIEGTGKLISTIRKEKELTQKQLAEQVGVSDRTISKWERGAGFPDVSLLTPLADALGCSVTDLLNGTREPHESQEQSIRDAVLVCCQQAKRQAQRNAAKIGAAVLLLAALLCAGGFGVHHLSQNRVLFPPKITSEVILDEGHTSGELLLKNANTGVYHYACRYMVESTPYLLSRNEWQSYEDTVSKELYKKLTTLCDRELLAIQKTETGTLCSYAEMLEGQEDRYTIIETTVQGDSIFRYDFDLQELKNGVYVTACVNDDQLGILFRMGDTASASFSWRIIDRAAGTEQDFPFTYRQLSGETESTESLWDYSFDRNCVWVDGEIFYFAATRYARDGGSILGAYDLKQQKSLAFLKVEEGQVMAARATDGVFQVLVNPKHYEDLRLYRLDRKTGDFLESTTMKLSYEFLADREAYMEGYYLSTAELGDSLVTVLFEANADLQAEKRHYILVGYHPDSGKMRYRSRLSVDTNYEIYEIDHFIDAQIGNR